MLGVCFLAHYSNFYGMYCFRHFLCFIKQPVSLMVFIGPYCHSAIGFDII